MRRLSQDVRCRILAIVHSLGLLPLRHSLLIFSCCLFLIALARLHQTVKQCPSSPLRSFHFFCDVFLSGDARSPERGLKKNTNVPTTRVECANILSARTREAVYLPYASKPSRQLYGTVLHLPLSDVEQRLIIQGACVSYC